MIRLDKTPIEKYVHSDIKYFVKREDLCTPAPGPTFSKVRGLVLRLEWLKKQGIEIVGYTESAVSMAGWGVAWACRELGMKCIIFDPQYKHQTPPLLLYHREKWKEHKASIIPQKAGMVRVNYNISKNILKKEYGDKAFLLPLGLTLPETVEATAEEARPLVKKYKTVVVNVGSGTIAAGLCRAFAYTKNNAVIYGIMGRSGSVSDKFKKIHLKSGVIVTDKKGMFGVQLKLIDPGWKYTEPCKFDCPFPCHPYYDLKAHKWMINNMKRLEQPILFWNIGSMPEVKI